MRHGLCSANPTMMDCPFRRAIAAGLAASALSQVGCVMSARDCDDGVRVSAVTIVSGEGSMTQDGVARTWAVSSTSTGDAPCHVDMYGIDNPGYGQDRMVTFEPGLAHMFGHISLFCFETATTSVSWRRPHFGVMAGLGDFRFLQLGEADSSEPAGNLWHNEGCVPDDRDRECRVCTAELPRPLVRVMVLEATGGPAAYPAMVTADFVRRFRFEVDTGFESVGTTWEGTRCEGRPVRATVELRVEAAHFVQGCY